MGAIRVKRRGRCWGVQERRQWGWLHWWQWIGPFGNSALGRWKNSADALWFANLCERVDARSNAA